MAIVLLIMGVLAAAAAPSLIGTISHYRVDAAARSIAADLTYARRRARNSGLSQTVDFTLATNSYELPGLQDPDHPNAAYIVKLSDTEYPSTLVSADFDGTATVAFDRYGLPDNGGSIVVESGEAQRTVVLDATTGRASVQ